MSLNIPTTSESVIQYLANFESKLNQSSPEVLISFMRILSIVEAEQDQGIYKLIAERSLQNLAITATGDDLDQVGDEYNVPRDQGAAAVLTVTVPATTGTVIPASTDFSGDSNGLRYFSDAAVTAVAGVATISLTAEDIGATSNIDVDGTLTIGTQIPGAETVATVTVVDTTGADAETDEEYRPNVLTAVRASTGGANATDHKIWGEEVSGVYRVFPYSGRPTSEGDSYPGDRLVYVEADTSIDADGIAPSSLLTSVRENIGEDPDTEQSRPPLGITDDRLWVESIYRTSIYTEIRDLDVDDSKESDLKADMETALDTYYRLLSDFLDGVEKEIDKNDTITNTSVSSIVQDILISYGATASNIGFGSSSGTFLTEYPLSQGELVKSGGVTYG